MMTRSSWLVLVACALVGLVVEPARAQKIAVFKSHERAPYDQAIEAIRDAMPDAEFEVLSMEGDVDKARDTYLSVRQESPDALVAVGTLALRLLAEETELPVVYTMLSKAERHHPPGQDNITGVNLDSDPRREFELLDQAMPDVQRIGVLHDPRIHEAELDAARDVADDLGWELVPVEALSSKDVPKALREMGQVDALWLLPIPKALNARSLEYVIVEMTKKRIPVLGDSEQFLSRGALFSLDPEWADVGRQTADLLERVLDSSQPPSFQPAERPANLGVSVNLRAAKLLKFDVPESIRTEARRVIE
ncbi:MAG: ABC transporter substrate binding protein [Acidobacteriota bacterium]